MRRRGRLAFGLALLLGALTAPLPAFAEGEVKGGTRDAPPSDPLFSIDAGGDAWSASRHPFGCFLVAPRGVGTHVVIIGQHRDYGTGIALVGFALSVSAAKEPEPVTIFAGGRELPRIGRPVAPGVLFVVLEPQEINLVLREIWYAGVIWVKLRGTSVAQGGGGAKQAVTSYGHICV